VDAASAQSLIKIAHLKLMGVQTKALISLAESFKA
jgi:hypothetical protein